MYHECVSVGLPVSFEGLVGADHDLLILLLTI